MHDSPTSPCAAPPQWARVLGTHSFDDALSAAFLPHRCHSLSRLRCIVMASGAASLNFVRELVISEFTFHFVPMLISSVQRFFFVSFSRCDRRLYVDQGA